ncbi:site-specific integrase [Companilactobacillus crustorum]|uniref:tyrosine-type recombinase/integrase n=1 Tax=Companilactobacillus crustorum TaxID=392416 RepID=UPI00237D3CE5|nr:tyrosine-type recombinase/integrase [Companilactobacillus crustorum]WDT66065.1 site-specific integrase [Companilactobacillus crustorum]
MASIFQNPNTGRYGYRIYYYDENGKRKSIQKTGFKLRREAIRVATKLENRKNETDLDKAERITFAQFFQEWMDTYKIGRFSESTDNKYKNAQIYIQKYFRGELLKDITKIDYQKFIDDYARNHVKDSIYRINGYIRTCIKEAMGEGLIQRDFTNNVIVTTKKKGKPKELKYLETNVASELKKIALSNASMLNISAYEILFALDTGARYAEIVGMTWDNIDFNTNTVSIRRTYDYKQRTGFLPTKTESSIRDITISNDLKHELKRLKLQQQTLFLKQGYPNKNNFVFINNRHEVPTDTAANKLLRHYLKMIDHNYYLSKGMSKVDAKNIIKQKSLNHEYIGFHGLRHTHASYLISKGLSMEYVSQRLGHSNVGITSKVYVHLLSDYKKKEDSKAMDFLQNL